MDYPKLAIRALAAKPGVHRIWLGLFEDEIDPKKVTLEWTLNGQTVTATPIRDLSRASSHTDTHTGVYELAASGAGTPAAPGPDRVAVTATWGGLLRRHEAQAGPFTTRPVPVRVPVDRLESFNVLAVSCFYEPTNDGTIGALIDDLSRRAGYQPHLVLTMGDQVYLDNPPFKANWLFWDKFTAASFEKKYRKNWQGSGYSKILQAAPVAAIPDDHEYWNNYPTPGAGWVPTWFKGNQADWAKLAKAMYDAFQLAKPGTYSYTINVAPLSILMLDTRTSRTTGNRKTAMGQQDVAALNHWLFSFTGEWLDGPPPPTSVPDSGATSAEGKLTVPVMVTGASLFQTARGDGGKITDFSLADYGDYPLLLQAIQRLSKHGYTTLTITGDVHYGRVLEIRQPTLDGSRVGEPAAYEVISSPVSLVPGIPMFGGKRSTAVRPEATGDRFSAPGIAPIMPTTLWPPVRAEGEVAPEYDDHVLLLQFTRTRSGVRVQPSYWTVHNPGRAQNPILPAPFTLTYRPSP